MAQRQQAAHYDYDAFVKKFEPKKTTDDCYPSPSLRSDKGLGMS